MKQLFILHVFSFLIPLSGFAQTQLLNFHQLTNEEGLSESTNPFLYTDRDKFTWIGSLDGLNRFDGKNVQVFKTNPNDTTALQGIGIQSRFFEDSLKNIWFTTGEGINCYIKSSGTFKNDAASVRTDSIREKHYAFYMEKERYLWVVEENHIFRYDTKAPEKGRIPIIENVEDMARIYPKLNKDGEVQELYGYNMANNTGLYVYRKKEHSKHFELDSLYFDSLFFYEIVHHEDMGPSICALSGQGLIFFDIDQADRFVLHPFPASLQHARDMEVVGNEIWLTNSTDMLHRFNLAKRTFESPIQAFNLDESRPINKMYRVFNSRDSILWVAVKDQGVYYANMRNRRSFSILKKNKLPEKSIQTVYKSPHKNIWCVDQSGAGWQFDQEGHFVQSLKFPTYFKAVNLNGESWAISSKGLGKPSAKETVFEWLAPPDMNYFNDSIPPGNPFYYFDILPYNDHQLLLAARTCVLLFDIPTQKYSLLKCNDNLIVKLMLDHKGRLWAANGASSLFVWEIRQDSLVEVRRFHNMDIMNDFLEDEERQCMWLATAKGLVRIDTHTDLMESTILTEANGLPNQNLLSVKMDHQKAIWLSTHKGIVRYLPEATNNQFKNFTSRDGLSSNEYNAGAFLVSDAGDLWLGSNKGVDVVDPAIQTIGTPPKLAINSLKIHNQHRFGSGALEANKKITLTHKENTLTFELSALEYTDPQRNQFEVYLSSNNKTIYHSKGTEPKITIPNLPPDDYQFEFTACNAEGIWQTNKHRITIEITPPFHQTWWFRTLVMLSLLLFVISISSFYYRYQLRTKALELEKQKRMAERQEQLLEKKLALQQERDRIAGEMHDELGGGLSTIRNASAKAERSEDPEKIKSVLRRVSEISFSLIKNMRELIWTMNPENDSLHELIARIRLYTAEFLFDNEIAVAINIPTDIPEKEMTSQARHHVYLTVKEVLHNVVKHAAATKVVFDLKVSNTLFLSICDNGKGFDLAAAANKGFGLKNLQNRMSAIGGRIEWRQGGERGVEVIIELPLE